MQGILITILCPYQDHLPTLLVTIKHYGHYVAGNCCAVAFQLSALKWKLCFSLEAVLEVKFFFAVDQIIIGKQEYEACHPHMQAMIT